MTGGGPTGADPGAESRSPGDPLLVDIAEGIATLTLNRPEALNALSLALKGALLDAVRRMAAIAPFGWWF